MRGLLQYTVPVDTPAMSPYAINSAYPANISPWQDTIAAGQTQSIYLPFYKILTEEPIASESLSKSRTGVFQGQFYGLYYKHRLSVTEIKEVRQPGIVNVYDIYRMLNEACIRHTPILWFKDVDHYPGESVYCMAQKVIKPKRVANIGEWTFTFDLLQMSSVQMPPLPPFVPV